MPDSSETTYPLTEALKALQALRDMAGMAPETFPLPAFVGMISDEIETLRKQGRSDGEIAKAIAASSSITVSAEEIAQYYATPEERQGHHG